MIICYELQRQVQIFVRLWKSLKALRVCVPLSYYAEGKRLVDALTKRRAKTYTKDAMHLDFLTFEAAASVALDTRTRGAAQVLRLPTSYLLA
jgi:hypothetical protein